MAPSLTPSVPQERIWDVEGLPVLRAVTSLPAPEGRDRAARRIRKYYALQHRAFMRYCQNALLPPLRAAALEALAQSRPIACAEAELYFRVTYQEGSLLSLYTQTREPGGCTARRGDTWDLAQAAPAALGSFLPKPRRWKRLFYDTAAAEVERRIRSGAGAYREDWRRHLKGALNPRDFYITGEGLCFFVPMYALGGPALGVPDFLIPWAQLRPAPPGEG